MKFGTVSQEKMMAEQEKAAEPFVEIFIAFHKHKDTGEWIAFQTYTNQYPDGLPINVQKIKLKLPKKLLNYEAKRKTAGYTD